MNQEDKNLVIEQWLEQAPRTKIDDDLEAQIAHDDYLLSWGLDPRLDQGDFLLD